MVATYNFTDTRYGFYSDADGVGFLFRTFYFGIFGASTLARLGRVVCTGCNGMHADDVRPFVSLSLSICLSFLATLFA